MATTKKADNGNGCVHYEADRKRYKALFTTPEGKRISKRFLTKAEANDWLASLRVDAAEGCFVEPSKMTLEQWVTEYLTVYAKPKVRQKTLESYAQTAAHLTPIKDIPIQKLTSAQVQKFLNNSPLSDSAKKGYTDF